jgi:hypothetical protein
LNEIEGKAGMQICVARNEDNLNEFIKLYEKCENERKRKII